MTGSRFPFRGRGEAAGFLLDPRQLGADVATRRVADVWSAGCRLLQLDDLWLLVLPRPVSVRAEQAVGLPVTEEHGRLVLRRAGRTRVVAPTDLAPVDLTRLFDLGDLQVLTMAAVPARRQAPAPVTADPAPPAAAPLRSRAGVGAADTALARSAVKLAQEAQRHAGTSRPRSDTMQRLLARSPVGAVVGRRHARYVERLTRSFDQRDWDQALRGAISLGDGAGPLTLRLPRRRSGRLRPDPAPGSGGGSVPFGPTVHEHLRELYSRAAQQLAQDGDIMLAAFVHADLLNQPGAAADLLEQHGLFAEAAELAEARNLDPSYAVRLWWRAGNRERALRIAIARGAFSSALARLGSTDPDAALLLRRAWIDDCRGSGDHLGAVTAGWSVPELRDELLPDIARAVAGGGGNAGEALAHWLEHRPAPEAVDLARRLLEDDSGDDPDLARGRFVRALSRHEVADPATDRELASLALVRLLAADTEIGDGFPDVVARLQQRSDPVLRADLPRIKRPVYTLDRPFAIDLGGGSLPIHDAAAVGPDSILVALGELGVRLLTRDGRTKARWDVPTHRLVVADHGRRALLVTDRAPTFGVHQLDLPGGRPLPLPPLDVPPLPGYDGSRAVLVSERGIEWVEPAGNRWRLVWRELTEPGQRIHQVQRTTEHMTALFSDSQLNVWHWSLPSVTLRGRSGVELAEIVAVVATGEVARLNQNAGVATLDWHATYGHRLSTETTYPSGTVSLLTSGRAFATVDSTEEQGTMAVYASHQGPASAVLHLPAGASPLLRTFGDLVLAGHRSGSLVVIDTTGKQLVGHLTLTE